MGCNVLVSYVRENMNEGLENNTHHTCNHVSLFGGLFLGGGGCQ